MNHRQRLKTTYAFERTMFFMKKATKKLIYKKRDCHFHLLNPEE